MIRNITITVLKIATNQNESRYNIYVIKNIYILHHSFILWKNRLILFDILFNIL